MTLLEPFYEWTSQVPHMPSYLYPRRPQASGIKVCKVPATDYAAKETFYVLTGDNRRQDAEEFVIMTDFLVLNSRRIKCHKNTLHDE